MATAGIEPLQVVYVEDSRLHARLLQAGLSVFDIEVLHLSQGDESVIEELSHGRYEAAVAIILDVNIGELSGLQVARRLRALGDGRPILVISSEDRPSASELMAIQAVFISKPFNFEHINETIRKLTNHA